MKSIYKDYLFNKHILVNEKPEEYVLETLVAMANLFGVRITGGQELASHNMIEYLSDKLGVNVPEPFYRGFPESVKKLTPDELLFDQLVHYSITYGFGHFEEPGHSLFETDIGRSVFKENTEIKDFIIISEEEAMKRIRQNVDSLFAGSRPLNINEFDLVKEYCAEFAYTPDKCASKNTAVKMIIDSGNTEFSRFLELPDVIKLVDELNYQKYSNENIRKLNLKNKDRKLITSIIDKFFERGKVDFRDCYEKKALWNGLLHHIHYKPVNDVGKTFLIGMRGNKNYSVFSDFEKAISEHDVGSAARIIRDNKGNGALLRNVVFLLKCCKNEEDINVVLNSLVPGNFTILLQLYIKYAFKLKDQIFRAFTFVKHGRLLVHYIYNYPGNKAFKPDLSDDLSIRLVKRLEELMRETLKNKLGKVYIDPIMKERAIPLASNTNSGGYGVMATGSRIRLKDTKKLRAFSYWEKINDIDLSVIGLDDESKSTEFSWRTMYEKQVEGITYSGDETSGFKGGSEYFDIVPELFKAKYPSNRYLVFSANVYSSGVFSDCICRAGYMTRDLEDSGEVFEPKTVETSFKIDGDSSFVYLFAFDIEKNEIIWLNQTQGTYNKVAADGDCAFLNKYLDMVNVINVYRFFEMAAHEVVSDIKDADVIVSDSVTEAEAGENKKIIRSYDFEKIKELMQ